MDTFTMNGKDRLRSEMVALNTELSDRFRETLNDQEKLLQEKEAAYRSLLGDAERGQLDLNGLKEYLILVADAHSCMDCLFSKVENKYEFLE